MEQWNGNLTIYGIVKQDLEGDEKMGMSTHIYGIKPDDKKAEEYRQIRDMCKKAGVQAPVEVRAYFENTETTDEGLVVEEKILFNCGAVYTYNGDGKSGFTVHLDQIPKDVKILRFVNSW